MKESQENQQNAETQRERYYATIHKVALQQAANTGNVPDKIPGEPLLRYGQLAGLVPNLYNHCRAGKSRPPLAPPLESETKSPKKRRMCREEVRNDIRARAREGAVIFLWK